MSTIDWKFPTQLMRGVVVEGVESSSIAAISTRECWERVVSISNLLADPSVPISVLCEIWPDTGRVIWIQKDRREFCRVEITIPELEKRYFEISADATFQRDYDLLISQVRTAVTNGAAQIDLAFAKHVVLRDSDDSATEEVLK